MLLLNFGHPLTESQELKIVELIGRPIARVLNIRTHFDPQNSFIEQARAVVEQVDLSPEQWQSTPLIINPPSLSPIACLVLAELHGRMGYFPSVVRLRPVPDTTPLSFEVAEVLNLQAVRDRARGQR